MTISNIPNIFFSFAGGVIVDRVGPRLCILIFISITFAGQLILSLSSIWGIYWLGVMGMVIFGVASNCASISESIFIYKWFKGKELTLSNNLDTCIGRLGTAISGIAQGHILSKKPNLYVAMFINLAAVGLSCTLGLILIFVEKKFDKIHIINDPVQAIC